MHRSGTSFLASVLAAAGVAVGTRLVEPDANNPQGYFEDRDFLELNRRLMLACTEQDEPGHRDWGWTESERLDRSRMPELRGAALELLARRRRQGAVPWGWKDPRTTLALDFWHDALEAAGFSPGYLLVYRSPWDVADAMQRLGADVFLQNPEYAYRIWTFYNRHLLDFHRRHRQRSLLVAIGAVLGDPRRFSALLSARLGLRMPEDLPSRLIAAGGLRARAAGDPLAGLVAATSPEAVRLFGELDGEADLAAASLWRRPGPLRAPRPRPDPPVVSVVIPCRDHGELLVEAVASAEAGAPGCELIVVNDGSRQPRTLEVLDTLRRAGYHVLDQAHAGLAAARNAGFACARGRYVLPLDADDRLRDGFVEPAVALLESDPGLGVVYGDRQMFGLRSGDVEVPEMDLDRLLAGNYIAACALVRKPAWESCGGYDPELAAWEDWDFWIALADRGWSFHHLPCIAFDHRIRPGSLVSQCESAEVGERLQQHIVRQHESLYRRRLPALLIQAQQGRAATQAAEQDRQRLSEAHAQAAAMRLDAAALREDIAALREDVAALRDERYRLYRELDSWRERVDFMASTRIWRMRDRLLRLRRAGAYTAPPALDRHRT